MAVKARKRLLVHKTGTGPIVKMKAITADGLADGGLAAPARITGEPSDIPGKGLIISPRWMADAIIGGRKTVIVKTNPYELALARLILLNNEQALGVIELGEMVTLDQAAFFQLEPKHLITETLRQEWCSAQEGWCSPPYYAWQIANVQPFSSPRETNVGAGPQVLVNEVVVKDAPDFWIHKIKDVATYEPAEVSDEVLRDDFRIALAWWANRKANPSFVHDEETIRRVLASILQEAKRRGPEVITFSPNSMASTVREFFEDVARQVGISPEQIIKQEVNPDMNVAQQPSSQLVEIHRRLHELYNEKKNESDSVTDLTFEDMVNLHALIVDELYSRGVKHPAPPDNGLDQASYDFEQETDKQPKWWSDSVITHKREYANIGYSGNEMGREIHLSEVLPCLDSFLMRKPYIYLVGGLANHGSTRGDIDILVRDTDELPEDFKHIIRFRLGRALPPELAERLQVHFDNFHGPFTNFVELYDLKMERCQNQEIKEMSSSYHEKETEEIELIEAREEVYNISSLNFSVED